MIVVYKYTWIVNTKETKYGLSKWPMLAPEQMDTNWAVNKSGLEIRRHFRIVGAVRFWSNFLLGINGTKKTLRAFYVGAQVIRGTVSCIDCPRCGL